MNGTAVTTRHTPSDRRARTDGVQAMHFVYSAVDLIDTSLISNRDLVPWRTDVHGTVVENLQRLYDTIQPQSWDRLRILYETTKGERRSGGGAAHPPLELRGELRALTPGAGPEEWLNDTDIGLALTGGAPGCLLNPYTKEEGLTVALTQNTSRGTRGVSSAVNDPTHRPFILLVGAPGHWKVLGIEPTQGRAYIFDSTGEPQNNLIRTLRAAIPKYKLIDDLTYRDEYRRTVSTVVSTPSFSATCGSPWWIQKLS